jgi:hypothetical protein
MSTNQPTPTGVQERDPNIQEVSRESVVTLEDAKVLDELRGKLSQAQPVERKRWRFW